MSSESLVLRVEAVGKMYRVGQREPYRALRDVQILLQPQVLHALHVCVPILGEVLASHDELALGRHADNMAGLPRPHSFNDPRKPGFLHSAIEQQAVHPV